MEIVDIIKLISDSAILMAGLTYLAKKIIDKSLDGATGRYKAAFAQNLYQTKKNQRNIDQLRKEVQDLQRRITNSFPSVHGLTHGATAISNNVEGRLC